MKFKHILMGAALVCACGGSLRVGATPLQDDKTKPAAADTTRPAIDPDKDKAIRHLLDVMGAAKLAMQAMQETMASMRKSDTTIPAEFWTAFSKKIKPEELVDLIVPIYDKHFSKEDIDGLLAFYQTPLGQKTLAALPAIEQESSAAGEKWGAAKAEEVIKEMDKHPATKTTKPKSKATGKSKGKS